MQLPNSTTFLQKKADCDRLAVIIDWKYPGTAQATNFAARRAELRQINQLKAMKLIRSLEQAKNFADKVQMLRPKKSHINC